MDQTSRFDAPRQPSSSRLPFGGLLALIAGAMLVAAPAAQANSGLAASRLRTDAGGGPAIHLASGGYEYPKKKKNYGKFIAGGLFALAVVLANQKNAKAKYSKTPKYAKKPSPKYGKKRPEPERDYSEIDCDGGRVRSGKCVCGDGETRKYHGQRRYSCVGRAVAEKRAPKPEKAAPVKEAPPPIDAANDEFAPDEVLTTFPLAAADSLQQGVARDLKLEAVEQFDSDLLSQRVVVYKIRDGRPVESVLAALRSDARSQDAQPNYYYAQQGEPAKYGEQDEPSGPSGPSASATLQYALAKIEAPEAQALARGRGALIALLDSLVDPRHPDLKASIAGLFDVTRDADYTADPHATAIAGIINANGAMRGVAPEAKLLSVRVVKTVARQGQGPALLRADSQTVGRGIEWSVAQNARVLVMPLLGRHDPFIERVIKAAYARQVIFVAPAGNKGPGAPPAYPAAYDEVVAVTATDSEDRIYEMANQGGYISLAAPGVNVLVLGSNQGHAFQSGTSMAAAHAAGLVALMLGYDPQLTADSVRKALVAAAVDLGAPGKDQKFGAGRISALASLRQLKQMPVRRELATPVYQQPQQPPPAAESRGPVSVGSVGSQRLVSDKR